MGSSRFKSKAARKSIEWLRRYLPNEIAGWAGELGAAAAVYYSTGSFALAVVAGTVGASVGYYATAYVNGVRWTCQAHAGRGIVARSLIANAVTIRSIAVEFGPAEVIDSVVIRPLMLYLWPFVLGNVAVGWVVGSLTADIAFYGMAIFSYERFKGLLVVRASASEEVDSAHAPTVTAA
jgi:hypothetical protein